MIRKLLTGTLNGSATLLLTRCEILIKRICAHDGNDNPDLVDVYERNEMGFLVLKYCASKEATKKARGEKKRY